MQSVVSWLFRLVIPRRLGARFTQASRLGLVMLPLVASAYTVSSVSAPAGHYKAGSTITITVTFSGPVDVTGTPLLTLNATGAPSASCATVTNSTTMTCSYTVAAGETAAALDYTNTTALSGGSIIDNSTINPTTLTLATPGAAGSISGSATVVVDTTAPTLPAANIKADNSVRPNTLQLTLSEEMTQAAALTSTATYTVKNASGTITYSVASASATGAGTNPTVVTLTLSTANPANTATYFTNADIAAHLQVTLASGLTDLAGNALAATTVTESGATATTDSTVPTLPAAGIQAKNSVQPNTITLTFSEPLANNAAVSDPTKYTVTNNGASITYQIASASQTSAGVVLLTLATASPASTATYMTNTDIGAHIKVGLASGLTDLAGNALTAATITESSASPAPVTDSTVPTLQSTLAFVDSTHVKVTFSEKMNKTKAETVTNYTLSGSGGGASLTGSPTAAIQASNGTDVTLTVPSLTNLHPGDTVVVTASTALQDLAGNSLAQTNATLTASNAPSAFSFSAVTNALQKSAVQSNAVTLSGINVPATISVVSGSDASLLCAIAPLSTGTFGAFAACANQVVNSGDQLKVQLTSAGTGNTTVTGTISIGGVSSTFSVTTASGVTVPSTVSFTGLTTLTGTLSSPDSAIYLSGNGVIVIPSSVTSTISFAPTMPANAAVLVQTGTTAHFSLGGVSLTVVPGGGTDALFVTKLYSIDGVSSQPVLELAVGRATLTYSGVPAPAASIQLGSGTTLKQMLIYAPLPTLRSASRDVAFASTTAAVTADMQRTSDGGALLAVTNGRAALRLASAASTVAIADAANLLYNNEVATLSSAGKITNIRVGSLDGTTGTVGDALPTSTLPNSVKTRVKIPNLNPALDRIDATKPLLQTLFDFIGSRTTLSQNSQGSYGQLPLLLNNQPLYVIPYGDVLVDTSRADGITLADDGHFEVSRSGVYVKLTTTASSLAQFAQAIQSAYHGTVTLTEDASYELNNGGLTILVKPDLVGMSSGSTTIGLDQNASGQLVFDTVNLTQTMFPHFYNLAQLATTFATLDPKMTLRDNLDGTVTAKLNGVPYTLVPSYEILSPIGGIPPEHRNDAWWASNDGTIYFKYPTGSAQGFTVH